MALLYIDGAETYTTMTQRWQYWQGAAIGAFGRNGTSGFSGFSTNSWMGRELPSGINEFYAGFAISMNAVHLGSTVLIESMDSTVSRQLTLKSNLLGGLFFSLNGSDTPIVSSTATGLLRNGVWSYVEVRMLIANSGGRAVAKVDGNTVIDFTGDTQFTALSNAFIYMFGGYLQASVSSYSLDDIYILDNTGSDNNTFLGDVRVQALPVTGVGNSTQFTPSAGSNWQNVDDSAPNDDTDYNSSSTVGQKDTFATTNMSVNASVKGVQLVNRWRKDDAGARTARSIIRSGGTDYEGGNVVMSDSYVTSLRVLDRNPNGNVIWTPADVNSGEVGYKIEA